MEPTEAGSVIVIVVVIGIVSITASGSVGGSSGLLLVSDLHVGGDHRFRAAWIVGQRAQQISVFVGFINDGIRLHSGVVVGRLCGG